MLILGIALLLIGLPLAWTALAAFGLQPDDTASPPLWTTPPSLDQFTEVGVAEPTFWQELATSAGLSVCATFLTMAIAFLAAYGLVRPRFAGQRVVIQSFLVLASLPVMAYVIPLSEMMRRVHLLDTFVGVALAETAVNTPLAVFVLVGYLGGLSRELEESAWLDGAGLGRVLWQVVLPLAVPGMAATAIILFVLNWNLFLVPLVLTAGNIKTIPVAMSDFFTFERELQWPTAAAALIISFLPLAVLVTVFHQLVNRFSLGSAGQPGKLSDL
jgi:ABC-type glycerol-3-phosphate transport system permease component